jgi:iron complex outermembrane receptor protein
MSNVFFDKLIFCAGGLFVSLPVFSASDSVATEGVRKEIDIDEIVIQSTAHRKTEVGKGGLASIDEYLQHLQKVNMIKRGGYAWEPVVNSMQTERLSTTIDGMKIFSACTDRMDPVTSYVETGNLQQINLKSGLDGNPQAAGNIGGSIDLRLRKVGFDKQHLGYNLQAGVESNGWVQVYGADAEVSSHRFYGNFGVFRRHADNYKTGDGTEVLYSQFTKVNGFANVGWQPKDNHILEATAIYDVATNVGYPALRMDVKSAKGLITALSYRRERMEGWFHRWETKLYYNRITHDMDDTHRPNVVIHMDMPGRSSTTGIYSLLQGFRGKHEYQLNYDLYYNKLYADMTMHPEGGAPMFMLTWPDVRTLNTGVSLSDDVLLSNDHALHFSAKVSGQYRNIASEEGYNALEIYFTDMARSRWEGEGHLSAGYTFTHGGWKLGAGVGYGNRTPTVTEECGYFLNNIFDQYDYIGNPNLKNETAKELNATIGWRDDRWYINLEGNIFFLTNYIIGVPETRLSSMTLGAAGVKIYRNLHSARIGNVALTIDYTATPWMRLHLDGGYAYGSESTGNRLPLIAPLTCKPSLHFTVKEFSLELGAELCDRHRDYSAKYGETETPGYAVYHAHVQWDTKAWKHNLTLRAGVENLLDRSYSTYSDWNHIPQKGRNFFLNGTYAL